MTFARLEFNVQQQINYSTPTGPKQFSIERKTLVPDHQLSPASYIIYTGFITKPSAPTQKEPGFFIEYRGSQVNKEIDLCNLLIGRAVHKNVTILLDEKIANDTVILIPAGSRIYCHYQLPANIRVRSVLERNNQTIKTELDVKNVGQFALHPEQKAAPKMVNPHVPTRPAQQSIVPSVSAVAAASTVLSNTNLQPPSHYVHAYTPPDGTCMYYAVALASLARFWECNVNDASQFLKLDSICRKLFVGQKEFTLSSEAVKSLPGLLRQHDGSRNFIPLIKKNDATFQVLVEKNLRNRLRLYMEAQANTLAANEELQRLFPGINVQQILSYAQDTARAYEWGELPQIFALSQLLKTCIIVYRGPNVSARMMPSSMVFGSTFKPNSEAIHLLFTGDHYDFYIHPAHIPKPGKFLAEQNKSAPEKTPAAASSLFFAAAKGKSKEELAAEKIQQQQKQQAKDKELAERKRKFLEESAPAAASENVHKKSKLLALSLPHTPQPLGRMSSAPHDTVAQRRQGTLNLQAWLANESLGSNQGVRARDYQKDVIRQFIAERNKQQTQRANALVVLPTGTGKTGVMSMLSGNSGEKHLILAPWVDVVTQTRQAILQFAPPGLRVAGVTNLTWTKEELVERRRLERVYKERTRGMTKEDARATVEYHAKHTYARDARIQKYKELIKHNDIIVVSNPFMYRKEVYKHFPWKLIDSISFDEVHHVVAPESKAMLLHLRNKEHKEVIGYTATPTEELYELFGFQKDGSDNPIKSLTMMEAIDKKALAPLQFVLLRLQKDTNNDKVNLTNCNITDALVERKLNLPSYTHAIINYCLNSVSQCSQKPLREMTTLISCAGIAHIKVLYKKINDLISVDQVDAHHVARLHYAQQILKANLETKNALIKRAKLDMQADELTLAMAQHLANSTFKVAAGLYSPSGKHDDDKKEDMGLDKVIYEMGGIRFMVTCGKLGEGYSLSRIEHLIIARMPTSKILVSQLGGRVSRLDAENPEKIGHITQVATDDAIDKIVLYADQHLVKDGNVHFCYPSKNLDGMSDNLERISIPGPIAAAKQHWEEPEDSQTIRIKRKQRLQQKLENQNHATHKAVQRKPKTNFLASIGELKKLIDELKLLFRKVEHMEMDETSEVKEPTTTNQQDLDKMQDALPPAPSSSGVKNQHNSGDGVITRSRHAFLLKAEASLTTMGNFLNPLYHALSTGAGWNEARRTTKITDKPSAKSEEILLAELCATAKDLLRKIFRLRRNQYVYTEQFIIDEQNEAEIDAIDHPDKLEQCINLLKDTLEKEKEPIIKAINKLKEAAKSKSKSLVIPLGIKKRSPAVVQRGRTRDYLKRMEDIVNDLDPDNALSIFALLKRYLENEKDELNSYYFNCPGLIIAKLNRDPSQWNSIDPETGDTVLHCIIKMGLTLQASKVEKAIYYNLLMNAFTKINPDLLAHRNNKGAIAIQIDQSDSYSKRKTNCRKVLVRSIMGYAAQNFDFQQSGFQDESFQIRGLPPSLELYYRAVRKKDLNLQDRNHYNNTVLHYLSTLPRYMINELLTQANLDFSLKNSQGKTALDLLFDHFYEGASGKQLVTLLSVLKYYPALLVEHEDIYHRALEQIVLTDKQNFPYQLLLEHFPKLDTLNKSNISLEAILLNSLKQAFANEVIVVNANLFNTLKAKKLSDKARDDLAVLFKECMGERCTQVKTALELAGQQFTDTGLYVQISNQLNVLNQLVTMYAQFTRIFELEQEDSFQEKITELSTLYSTEYKHYLSRMNEQSGEQASTEQHPRKRMKPVEITALELMESMQDSSTPFLHSPTYLFGEYSSLDYGASSYGLDLPEMNNAPRLIYPAIEEKNEEYSEYYSDSSDAEEEELNSEESQDEDEFQADSPPPISHKRKRVDESEDESANDVVLDDVIGSDRNSDDELEQERMDHSSEQDDSDEESVEHPEEELEVRPASPLGILSLFAPRPMHINRAPLQEEPNMPFL